MKHEYVTAERMLQRINILESQQDELLAALTRLAGFCLSGRRYEQRNPYCIPEIIAALDTISAVLGAPRYWEDGGNVADAAIAAARGTKG